MVRYLSSGVRRFGSVPIGSHSRLNWEFYAVVDGRCGVLLDTGEKLPLRSRCIWVFPPHHVHGWHGEKRHCNVVVVHCGTVPRPLAEAIPPVGFLEHILTEIECRQIAELGRALDADFHNRNTLSELRFDRAIIDLSLLALEGLESPSPNIANQRIMEKVDAAVSWFRRHLREHPTMEEVAAAVHVSPSHLRRLFMIALRQSPRTVLGNAQIEIAMKLLSGSDLKIESVAAEAGFASARDFSRVFSAHQGCSPSDWRRKVQPPYQEIGAAANGNGSNGA
jgi:AraC family transcriptional regulator